VAQSLTVILDPGHGGSDPGAIGASGTPEKAYNLETALLASALLQQAGIGVVLTRSSDETVSLEQRLSYQPSGDLWISIHHNASPNHQARGTETFLNPEMSRRYSGPLPPPETLAREVQGRVVRAIRTANRGVRYRQDLYLLNRLAIPAVLVEVCFIDHPDDEAKVLSESGRLRVAYALVGAIGAYAGVSVPQPFPWASVALVVAAAGGLWYGWRVILPKLERMGAVQTPQRPSPGPASA